MTMIFRWLECVCSLPYTHSYIHFNAVHWCGWVQFILLVHSFHLFSICQAAVPSQAKPPSLWGGWRDFFCIIHGTLLIYTVNECVCESVLGKLNGKIALVIVELFEKEKTCANMFLQCSAVRWWCAIYWLLTVCVWVRMLLFFHDNFRTVLIQFYLRRWKLKEIFHFSAKNTPCAKIDVRKKKMRPSTVSSSSVSIKIFLQ